MGRATLIEAFEESLCAVWVRARISLGGATLKAVFDRVLDDAKARHPYLGFVEVTFAGVRFHREDARPQLPPTEQLQAELDQVVAELVDVLGNLSGRVLALPLRAAVESARMGPTP